jgi:hypothetical protein
LWGAPRIHGELLKLGFEVAQWSVATLARHAWAFSFCSFCSYRPERAASHANGASFNRPDPPLGHGDPALDTRTDAKSARMPSTIPIKKFDGLPSDLVRPPQSEARHRAPDNRWSNDVLDHPRGTGALESACLTFGGEAFVSSTVGPYGTPGGCSAGLAGTLAGPPVAGDGNKADWSVAADHLDRPAEQLRPF